MEPEQHRPGERHCDRKPSRLSVSCGGSMRSSRGFIVCSSAVYAGTGAGRGASGASGSSALGGSSGSTGRRASPSAPIRGSHSSQLGRYQFHAPSSFIVEDVGAVTARERPDVALVGLGESSDHALGLIERIVQEAACPVIVLIHARDADFVKEASKRGVFAHISDADVDDWQSAIDITLRRFAEYHELEGAFGRRALTERAKGILMERHAINEATAFELLREHSRIDNRKLIDLATAIVDGHRLLPKQPQAPPQP